MIAIFKHQLNAYCSKEAEQKKINTFNNSVNVAINRMK